MIKVNLPDDEDIEISLGNKVIFTKKADVPKYTPRTPKAGPRKPAKASVTPNTKCEAGIQIIGRLMDEYGGYLPARVGANALRKVGIQDGHYIRRKMGLKSDGDQWSFI